MANRDRNWKRIISAAEMRIFWVALPFLAAGIILDALYLPLALSLAGAGIAVAVGVAIFWVSYRTAARALGTRIEASELKNIVTNLGDALIVYDQDFRIRFFNPTAERLFHAEATAIVGQTIQPSDVEKPDRRLLVQVLFPSLAPTLVPRTKAGEYPQIADLSFTDPALELQVTTSPIADEQGKLYGFMKIVRDRTRELLLLKAKTDFISVASHQLRTPINEVKWAVELLTQDAGLSAESRGIAERTLKSVTSLAELVDNLLDVARIEEGRFGYAFEGVNLVDFLGTFLAAAMPQAERAGLKLYFDRPESPLPTVHIDPKKLSMVMSNLLDNAIRYNVANGTITVKVSPAAHGPFLEVSVKDTGIGIPPSQIDKLFAKFFRGDNAAKSQAEGTGLGLYIAKNVIRAHGGQLWAESELNRGSTFHFTVPTDPTVIPTKEVALEE